MKASVEVLASMDVKGKKICVLGDMFELGEIEKTGHEEVGTCVGENDIDYLICVGKLSQATYEAAIKAGMNNNNAWYFENIEDAKAKLKEVENKGVKGLTDRRGKAKPEDELTEERDYDRDAERYKRDNDIHRVAQRLLHERQAKPIGILVRIFKAFRKCQTFYRNKINQ